MRLKSGTHLGHFEILGDIGSGAMGEVYRARDTKLGRDVALKVLPASVASDADRLARLRHEAQMVAALNHPNIAQIHGLEDAVDVHALVLELVEGDTLADRIARGPLPLGEALAIAAQLAAALEAAHDAGVIHRDFKPANVKVRDDGTVKVLDFGLAKPVERQDRSGAQGAVRSGPGSDAPTMRSPLASEHGMVVGTANYMAPEQAQGKDVDKRADIWAFGVVLVEMLTGRRPFDGATLPDTISAVVTRTPDLSRVPAQLHRLVGRCLDKDPRKRLRDIGDALSLVDDLAAAPRAPGARRWFWPALTAGLSVVAAAALWRWSQTPVAPASPVRFQVDAPAGTEFNYTYTGTAISPDGRSLVFRLATVGGAPMLWVRPLGSLTARVLSGTENGDFPFWSADGQSVGFFSGGRLKRVDLAGGAAIGLCDAPDIDTALTSGSWNRDGVILFGSPEGLRRVASSTALPELIAPVAVADGETGYGSPQFLPDGDRFLFFVRSSDPVRQGLYASALSDLRTKRLILATDRKAVYVPNEGGDSPYLLYAQEQTLLARRIDGRSLRFDGDPAAMAAGIALFPPGFHASFWVSAGGVLAYRTTASDKPRLTWVSADRSRQSEPDSDDFYTHVRLSPDATRAALEVSDGTGNMDVWIWDFARHSKTQQTFDTRPDRTPVWAPNGHEIAFSSIRTGVFQIYRKDLNTGQPEVALTTGPSNKIVMDWSADGRYLVYVDRDPTTAEDVWALPVGGSRQPFPLVRTAGIETNPSISPDGKWLAFETSRSGRPEVYVQRFVDSQTGAAEPGARWQISTQGGGRPRWSSDGRRLYFLTLNEAAIFVADIRATAAGLEHDPPRVFAEIPVMLDTRSPYDVATTGGRLLLLERTINQGTPLIVVTNWIAEVARRK